jgi:excisionase family DNA binding protein
MATKKSSKKAAAERPTMGFSTMALLAQVGDEKLLTVTEAARLRGTTTHAIRELIHRKRLPATEIAGRYFVTLSDLRAFEPATHKQKFDMEAEGWFDVE